jgi:PadR family transcriptional regulator, regulatory protein PadR
LKDKIDLLQGTLDLLVLKALTLEPLHGLDVSRRIEQITKGAFLVNPGSLFPPYTAWRKPAGSNPPGESPRTTAGAKYYCLTKAGQCRLEAETEDWQHIAIASALKTA